MPKVDDIFSDKIDNTRSVIVIITSFLELRHTNPVIFMDLKNVTNVVIEGLGWKRSV